MAMLTMLLAMQQADAAFPSGSFAFSNGVEGLAALPFPFDRAALLRHADAAIRHRWAGTDRVALIHAFRAWSDIDRLAAIDDALEIATLAEPLRTGSQRAGRAFLASHSRLETPCAGLLKDAIADRRMLGHLATIQGCLWRSIGLSEHEAVAISGYQTVSGLASASVRLGRLGAIDAQTVVRDMLPLIEACNTGLPKPDDDGIVFESFVPFIEIAAMRSASADLRLFAN
jgi:urease accessory protein